MKRTTLPLLMSVLFVLGSSGCGDDSGDATTRPAATTTAASITTAPTTTTETSTPTTAAPITTTTDAEPIEVRIARESMEVWNSGDVEGYLAFYADDATLGYWPAHSEHVREGCEFWMALGDQTVMDECEVWQDGRIRCHTIGRDDLSGPAGEVLEGFYSFWFADGKITKLSLGIEDEGSRWFLREMAWWLEDAHPDVWESTFAISERCNWREEYNCFETWYGTAEVAAVLLEYRDEFVAQSGLYSLSE